MLTTALGHHSWVFAQEARQEVRKIVWPTRQEPMQTTLMVFAMVIIVGFALISTRDKIYLRTSTLDVTSFA
jgi:preprotein translocase subunit SecE